MLRNIYLVSFSLKKRYVLNVHASRAIVLVWLDLRAVFDIVEHKILMVEYREVWFYGTVFALVKLSLGKLGLLFYLVMLNMSEQVSLAGFIVHCCLWMNPGLGFA